MTKPDKIRLPALSIEQTNAIDLLIVGKTDSEVAAVIGKTRQTVCGWRLYHPVFQAELNKRRRAIWGTAADKLRSLLPKALSALEQELEGGDNKLKAALEMVKLAGIQMGQIGAIDPEEIVTSVAQQRELAVLTSLGRGEDPAQVCKELLAKAEEGEENRVTSP
jgi:hypothetical protein